MDQYVVIVAGGSGKRMGMDTPKQFLELAGRPVLMHTIERFREFNDSIEIITVLPENQLRFWAELQRKYSFDVPHTLVKGGSKRFVSVQHGLAFVNSPGLVAIHDGVRPLVRLETIKRCFETAEKYGNAIPVVSPADSLRMEDKKGNSHVDRLKIKQVQTPQVFDVAKIKKAYLQDFDQSFTDDATVLEKTGEKIHLVEGNRENIKITNPEDLFIAQTLLSFIS
ncbi:MAG: 2-C-methyl-D-erythritol 4-phosphate cytidylyltransferase [Odoribacter sp.]|nr:2-C-methyl-D-erythritol 4-phosphate cytidylyltransferase [Odoribacter sp.]